jgi:hypothetical protein
MTAPGASIVAALAGHGGPVAANYVLTEGLPAFGLVVVSAFLARALRMPGTQRLASTIRALGLAAAAISLTQCVLGIALARTSSPGTARELFDLVNQLDGVKMLALAGIAGATAFASGLPGWLRYLSASLAILITGSGVAYLLMLSSIAWLAYPAGILLLAFIPAAGYVAGRSQPSAI